MGRQFNFSLSSTDYDMLDAYLNSGRVGQINIEILCGALSGVTTYVNGGLTANAYSFSITDIYDVITIYVSEISTLAVAVTFADNLISTELIVDMIEGIEFLEMYIDGSIINEPYVIDTASSFDIISNTAAVEDNLVAYFNAGQTVAARLGETSTGDVTLNGVALSEFSADSLSVLSSNILVRGSQSGSVKLEFIYSGGVLCTIDIIVASELVEITITGSESGDYYMPYNGQTSLIIDSLNDSNSLLAFINAGGQMQVTIENLSSLEFTVNGGAYTVPFIYDESIVIIGTGVAFTAGSIKVTISFINAENYSLINTDFNIIFTDVITETDIVLSGMQTTAHVGELITLNIDNALSENILKAYFNDNTIQSMVLINMTGTGEVYINGFSVIPSDYEITSYNDLKNIELLPMQKGTVLFTISFANYVFTIQYEITILELASAYAKINDEEINQDEVSYYYSEQGEIFTLEFDTLDTDALDYYLLSGGSVNVSFIGTAEFSINGVSYSITDSSLTKNLFTDFGAVNFTDTLSFIITSGSLTMSLIFDLSIFDSLNVVNFYDLNIVSTEPMTSLNLILENSENTNKYLELNATANLIFDLSSASQYTLSSYFALGNTVTVTVDEGQIKFEEGEYSISLIISDLAHINAAIIYEAPAIMPVSTHATFDVSFSRVEILSTELTVNIVPVLELELNISGSTDKYFIERTKNAVLSITPNDLTSLESYFVGGGTITVISTSITIFTINSVESIGITSLSQFNSITLTLRGATVGDSSVPLSDTPRNSNSLAIGVRSALSTASYDIGGELYLNDNYYVDKNDQFAFRIASESVEVSEVLKAYFNNAGYALRVELQPQSSALYNAFKDGDEEGEDTTFATTITFTSYEDISNYINFTGKSSGLVYAVLSMIRGASVTNINTLFINVSILQSAAIGIDGISVYPSNNPYLIPIDTEFILNLFTLDSPETLADYFATSGNRVRVVVTSIDGDATVTNNEIITELVGGELPPVTVLATHIGVITISLIFENGSGQPISVSVNDVYVEIVPHLTEVNAVLSDESIYSGENITFILEAGEEDVQFKELVAFLNAGGEVTINITKQVDSLSYLLGGDAQYHIVESIIIDSKATLKDYILRLLNTEYSENFTFTPVITSVPSSYILNGTVINSTSQFVTVDEALSSIYFIDSQAVQDTYKEVWYYTGSTDVFKLDISGTTDSGTVTQSLTNMFALSEYIKLTIMGYDADNKYITFTDSLGAAEASYFDIKSLTDLNNIYIKSYQKTISNMRLQIALYNENDVQRYVTNTSYCDIKVVTDILKTANLGGNAGILVNITSTYQIIPSSEGAFSGSTLLAQYFTHGGTALITISDLTGLLAITDIAINGIALTENTVTLTSGSGFNIKATKTGSFKVTLSFNDAYPITSTVDNITVTVTSPEIEFLIKNTEDLEIDSILIDSLESDYYFKVELTEVSAIAYYIMNVESEIFNLSLHSSGDLTGDAQLYLFDGSVFTPALGNVIQVNEANIDRLNNIYVKGESAGVIRLNGLLSVSALSGERDNITVAATELLGVTWQNTAVETALYNIVQVELLPVSPLGTTFIESYDMLVEYLSVLGTTITLTISDDTVAKFVNADNTESDSVVIDFDYCLNGIDIDIDTLKANLLFNIKGYISDITDITVAFSSGALSHDALDITVNDVTLTGVTWQEGDLVDLVNGYVAEINLIPQGEVDSDDSLAALIKYLMNDDTITLTISDDTKAKFIINAMEVGSVVIDETFCLNANLNPDITTLQDNLRFVLKGLSDGIITIDVAFSTGTYFVPIPTMSVNVKTVTLTGFEWMFPWGATVDIQNSTSDSNWYLPTATTGGFDASYEESMIALLMYLEADNTITFTITDSLVAEFDKAAPQYEIVIDKFNSTTISELFNNLNFTINALSVGSVAITSTYGGVHTIITVNVF